MNFKNFTTTNEKLPVLGLGTWSMGGSWYELDDGVYIEAIRSAVENEINFIDTAPIYGMGKAENIVGKAIKPLDRSKLFLATKCGLVWNEKKKVKLTLKADSIKREIDESLKRLGTDYVDLYQCHWPDPETSVKETMEALVEIQKSGKVRYIGVSNFSLAMLKESGNYADIVSYQGLFNMLEHNATHYHRIELAYRTKDEILPYCAEHGIFFLPYSPLMQGLLSGKFTEKDNFSQKDDRMSNPKLRGEELKPYLAVVEKLKEFANEIGHPLVEIALNWLIWHKEVGPVICGMNKPEYVASSVASLQWELSEEQLRTIDSILAESIVV